MVLGVLSNITEAETLLNNLIEADFDPKDLSVAMTDQESVTKIADVSGPLTGEFNKFIPDLKKMGISQNILKHFQKIVLTGGVLICVSTANLSIQRAAKEMFEDMNANLVIILPNK